MGGGALKCEPPLGTHVCGTRFSEHGDSEVKCRDISRHKISKVDKRSRLFIINASVLR